MKFTRLRLVGFKSFVEPMEFVIEKGLTGVVGPNGCGKSNLVEAMRWVMGESSYKNMRASGMDDVIFSGSGNRPARNTAEVGLFLDNADRTAPAIFNDADEIQVSRRIERDSGSVYRINGKEARAKDVQLLFADASTGARSPSMVGQGRIGELIQAKPQARRQLLEEAAGISGLHSRRHEAELRLRAAETNLERLDDVTSELEGQIESLKRQARQANRFKALSADIRHLDATLLHIRWHEAKSAEAEAESALSAATNAVAEAAQEQMEAAKDQAIGAAKLPELREDEAKAAAALQRLQIARAQIDEEAERVTRRKAELERRLAQLGEDIAREQRLIADNAGVLARLGDEERTLRAELDGSDERAAATREAFDLAARKLSGSEAEHTALTRERAESAATRAQMDRTARDLGERIARLERQIGDAERELSAIDGKIGGLPDPDQRRAALDAAEAELEACETRIADGDAAVERARAAETAARRPVQEAHAALAGIETEARTIRKMLRTGNDGAFAPVVERMTVERGYEAALGAALGDDLDIPTESTAPAFWSRVEGSGDDPALPAGLKALSAFVTAPAELARRLAQIGVVDGDGGERLQGALKPGQRLVGKDGALWRWDGFVANADAPTPAALRLAQKNRLDELDTAAAAAGDAVSRSEAAEQAAEAELRGRLGDQQEARDARRTAQAAVSKAREELAEAERASGQLASRRAVLDESCSQIAGQLDESRLSFEEARAALAQAPDLTELDRRLEGAAAVVATDRAGLAETRAAHEGLERENIARHRRLAAIADERHSWTERAEGAERHIGELKERASETESEAAAISEAPDEIERNRRRLMSQLSEAEAARSKAGDVLAGAENAQRAADRAATDAIARLSTTRENRGRIEERLSAGRERRGETEARIREVLRCAPHEAMRLTGLAPGADLPDPVQVEKRLERLKIERERLGAVNLRAEEEQSELAGRLETIVAERGDVVEAIGKLRTAILGLNREGRERLLAAFDVVNGHFGRLFTHLFGGGTAELQLVESEDPLDAGLEILARPPGKKPQTMTLLSGGEQALTAMAMIFAVFLTNPAPICVLDEVDAPLDDHNVERYCNLMEEMARSTETRFVIITHNPITMARMNRLFGVTMAEQGVSQLVSVDLETAEQLREAV